MTIKIIIVHPPDYNEQANLPVVSLLSLRRKDGLSMGFKHNRVLTVFQMGEPQYFDTCAICASKISYARRITLAQPI